MSIQDRIAALNLGQVGRSPLQQPQQQQQQSNAQRPPPPALPARTKSAGPQIQTLAQTPNQPIGSDGQTSAVPSRRLPPPPPPRQPPGLPPRQSATSPGLSLRQNATSTTRQDAGALTRAPPVLPPRQPSSSSIATVDSASLRAPEQRLTRISSSESISSTVSGYSQTSTPRTSQISQSDHADSKAALQIRAVRAPAFDVTSLPPLPPKRDPLQVTHTHSTRGKYKPKYSTPASSKSPAPPTTTPVPATRTALTSTALSRIPSAASEPEMEVSRTAIKAPPPTQWGQTYVEPQKPVPQETEPTLSIPTIALRPTALQSLPTIPSRPQSTTLSRPQPAVPSRPQLPSGIPASAAVQTATAAATANGAVPRRSALSWGMNKASPVESQQDSTSEAAAQQTSEAPPVPRGSRPDLGALLASKPKPGAVGSTAPLTQPASSICLKCWDFSGPDAHAARYPRESLPSHDVAWLAHQLADPFPRLTDKARALFTWQHHNIAYNIKDYRAGVHKPATPAYLMETGMAVCAGYAALFAAMAVHVGLEAVVICGHGAGDGYTRPAPGQPCPPRNPTGHAWNAVRLDDGQWKLIDVCWGAGHVDATSYTKHFSPHWFTMDNETFGYKHYPEDAQHFYRRDGCVPSWETYYMGEDCAEPVEVYNDANAEGFEGTTAQPRQKRLSVRGQDVVRFSISRVCAHWSPTKNGQGADYPYILKVGGVDGRAQDYKALQTNGHMWWVDVPRVELGCAGQDVMLYKVTTINGNSARGVTAREYLAQKGRCAMSFGGIARWSLC